MKIAGVKNKKANIEKKICSKVLIIGIHLKRTKIRGENIIKVEKKKIIENQTRLHSLLYTLLYM